YIGGSQDNSFQSLTFGYNGFGRLSGDETGGAGGSRGGTLGAGAGPRGQVGAGQGPRAALPGAGPNGNRPGAPGGARGPQAPQGGRQNGAAFGNQDAFGNPQDPFGGQDAFGNRGPVPPQRAANPSDQGRQPQLPPRGGPRAELPGGNPQGGRPSWSDDNAQPPLSRASLDTPRGHDEQDQGHTAPMPRIDERHDLGATSQMPAIPQGPSATGEFPRPDFTVPGGAQNTGSFPRPNGNGQQDTGSFPRPGANGAQDTGSFPRPNGNGQQDAGPFVRSDVFGTPAGQPGGPQNTGQFAAPQAYDNGSTGQFATPPFDGGTTGQHALPGRQNGFAGNGQGNNARSMDFGTVQRPPVRQEPEALPPASGPGDGRTPLYDTLETNWFHGGQQEQHPQGNGNGMHNGVGNGNGAAPLPPAPVQPPAPAAAAPQRSATSSWRPSPNDDLVRQAERVRQPAAGGVTTSGLPRRVPRANLVPGTAQQQQQHQAGPQVSRSPDDVRGRLTNLRRGIAQGRQAAPGPQTGSFPSPTHQQER
ncbi:hypothetical protein ABZ646_43760, partial [Streptomyces sp. NPDC007162]